MQTILCYHGFVQVVTDKRIENITAINREEGMTDRRKRIWLKPCFEFIAKSEIVIRLDIVKILYSINLIVKRIKQFYTIKINYFRTRLSYLYKFCYEIYRILLHFVQDKSGQVWNTFVCTCEYTHIKARIQW